MFLRRTDADGCRNAQGAASAMPCRRSASQPGREGDMRFLESRTYAGEPGETVTIDTEVDGGGHVTLLLDGREVEADAIFQLKPNAGDETQLRIALFGAVGESCVASISEVDGGRDVDLLLCQQTDPAPVHFYRFIVTRAGAINALARATVAPASTRAASRGEVPRATKPSPPSGKPAGRTRSGQSSRSTRKSR